MYKNISISKDWANSVTYLEFKKNSIVAVLTPKEQRALYKKLTNKVK
jgi:hypothetical protein